MEASGHLCLVAVASLCLVAGLAPSHSSVQTVAQALVVSAVECGTLAVVISSVVAWWEVVVTPFLFRGSPVRRTSVVCLLVL